MDIDIYWAACLVSVLLIGLSISRDLLPDWPGTFKS